MTRHPARRRLGHSRAVLMRERALTWPGYHRAPRRPGRHATAHRPPWSSGVNDDGRRRLRGKRVRLLTGLWRGHRWRRAAVAGPVLGQRVRGLGVIGGEDVHRVTASTSAAAGPGIWPGGLQRAPTASADA